MDKKCVLLAPTGRASINIGGQTIHSFFYLDSAVIQPENYKDKKIKVHLDVTLTHFICLFVILLLLVL